MADLLVVGGAVTACGPFKNKIIDALIWALHVCKFWYDSKGFVSTLFLLLVESTMGPSGLDSVCLS